MNDACLEFEFITFRLFLLFGRKSMVRVIWCNALL